MSHPSIFRAWLSLFLMVVPVAAAPPPLPAGVEVIHPGGDPLAKALRPVPETAVFKMDGWYLWDPSVIKVGDTWHLFASRWPASEKMKGWFHSHVIREPTFIIIRPVNAGFADRR